MKIVPQYENPKQDETDQLITCADDQKQEQEAQLPKSDDNYWDQVRHFSKNLSI